MLKIKPIKMSPVQKNLKTIPQFENCPVQHTLQYIGGKWRFALLWNLRVEAKRFGELKRALPGITEKMLIQELKHFEKLGVVSRKSFGEVPPRVEYSLTEKGQSLLPLVSAVIEWGRNSLQEARGLLPPTS